MNVQPAMRHCASLCVPTADGEPCRRRRCEHQSQQLQWGRMCRRVLQRVVERGQRHTRLSGAARPCRSGVALAKRSHHPVDRSLTLLAATRRTCPSFGPRLGALEVRSPRQRTRPSITLPSWSYLAGIPTTPKGSNIMHDGWIRRSAITTRPRQQPAVAWMWRAVVPAVAVMAKTVGQEHPSMGSRSCVSSAMHRIRCHGRRAGSRTVLRQEPPVLSSPASERDECDFARSPV